MGSQAGDVLQRAILVVVQAELGRLHRDLAVQPARPDRIEDPDVVVRDGIRGGQALEILPELRVHGPDARGLQRRRGVQRGVHGLAGHEPTDGPLHERTSVAGGP